MNEPIGYRLFRDGGVAAPRTSYARVYLTIPGKYDKQYVGLYSVVEEVDNNFAQERFGTKEGAIFKPETQSLFAYLGEATGRSTRPSTIRRQTSPPSRSSGRSSSRSW